MAKRKIARNSSCVADAEYDDKTKELTISFVKGGSHTYSNVPKSVVSGLRRASSKGKFFNANIRNDY